MKKALLYLLLFAGVTSISVLCGILLFGVMNDSKAYESWGLDAGDALVYCSFAAVLLWSSVLTITFYRNRFASLSFGRMKGNDRFTLSLLCALATFMIGAVSYWIHTQLSSYSGNYANTLDIFRNHGLVTFVSLVLLYITTQLVFTGAILRELLEWSRHTWTVILLMAAVTSLINLSEGAIGLVMFAFAVANGALNGWVFFKTRTIWPIVIGSLVADFALMVFFSNSPGMPVAIASILLLPPVIYAIVRMTEKYGEKKAESIFHVGWQL